MEQIEETGSALNGLEGLEPQEPTENRLPEISVDQLSETLQAALQRAGWAGIGLKMNSGKYDGLPRPLATNRRLR